MKYSDKKVTKIAQILMKYARSEFTTPMEMKDLDELTKIGFLMCITQETQQYKSIQSGEKVMHVPGKLQYEFSTEGLKLLFRLRDPLTRLIAIKELRERLNEQKTI